MLDGAEGGALAEKGPLLAALLARVFAFGMTVCPARGGRLRLIAALTDPASVRRDLSGVGLPSRPRPPPQTEWDIAA